MPAEPTEQVDVSPDTEHLVFLVQSAIQTVQCPSAYVPTGRGLQPRDEAAGAERAKAVTGLMLFMIEGLVRATVRARDKGIVDVPSMVHLAWRRWYQLHRPDVDTAVSIDGWLVSAFPTSLLTTDEEVIELLAGAAAHGTAVTRRLIVVPSAFFVPVQLFGRALEMPQLVDDLAAALGVEVNTDPGLEHRCQVNHDPLTARLAHDFVQAVTRHGAADPLCYPGH